VIFVDTSFWVAVSAARDANHDESRQLLQRHASQSLVTSSAVRGETWTFLRRRYGHRIAVAFLDRIDRSRRVAVRFVTESQEGEAMRWLRRHDEREYSFVDATSFVVMRALRIRDALAFDGDFAAAGFIELRAD
jgi:uncharacterized protein